MESKNKVLMGRAVRSLVATIAGVLAAYLAGPNGVNWIHDPQAQSFVVMVVVPVLITIDKMMRFGSDVGESTDEPVDSTDDMSATDGE